MSFQYHLIAPALSCHERIRGGAHPASPLFSEEKEFLKYLSFANSEGGPKRLKSDSCEAESCFPGYRIIETTDYSSDLFESIANQLVAGTYNVPAPSHIDQSWYPMFARTPQWLLKSLQKVCIIIMYAPWCGIIRPPGWIRTGTHVGHRTLRQMGVRIHGKGQAGFLIVKYRRSAPSRVQFHGKFHQAVAGWTVNLSGFIQICLSLSHVVVGLTVRILLCSVQSRPTRSGPFATRLSVCLSV